MTTGIKACRRIQIGKETTQGTMAAATTLWRGTGTIQDNLTVVWPDEDIGILPGVDRSYIPRVEAQLSLDSTPATFQQLPYLFEMGIRTVTPTTDTNSEGVWSYEIPVACTDTITSTDLATYSFRGGDNVAVEGFTYGFVRSMVLSGSAGEALMMSAEVIGRQVATTDWTPALSVPTVQEILFSKGALYIDATTTDAGTTKVSNEFLDMNLSITGGWTPVYTAEGNLFYSFIKQAMPEIILSVTFEHATKSIAEKAYWRAQTPRLIRVRFDGTTGHQLTLDMAGKWDNFNKLGERDGNDIVEGTFRARYNSTAALFFKAVVKCGTLGALV